MASARHYIAAAAALIGSTSALGQIAPRPDQRSQAEGGELRILIIPGESAPAQGPIEGPSGAPSYGPALPSGTPTNILSAGPARPLVNLTQALQAAYWTNPNLLAERARLRSVDYRLPQARARYGPQLQYSTSYGFQHNRYEQPIGAPLEREGWASTASAVLAQPLFTFGRLRAGEDAARAQVAFQRAALLSAEQQTLLQAITAYTGVLRDRARLQIAVENVDLLGRQFSGIRTRVDLRDATVTDLRQVQTRLELGQVELLSAEGASRSSEALFLRIAGAPAGELAPPNPLTLPVQTLDDAYAYAQTQSPVLASAYARERLSRAELRAARAELLPRVDLRAQASRGTSSTLGPELSQTEARAAITISGILDAGLTDARISEAAAANDADWRLIDAALRENRAELAEAWAEWQAQNAVISRLEIASAAAQQALDGALLQERAGLRTTLEILELSRDLLQVRTSFNAASAAAYVAKARVLAAIGALHVEYLLPEAEHYDVQEHFERVDGRADIPLLTPVVRAFDSVTKSPRTDRQIRDPSASVAVGAHDQEGRSQ